MRGGKNQTKAEEEEEGLPGSLEQKSS